MFTTMKRFANGFLTRVLPFALVASPLFLYANPDWSTAANTNIPIYNVGNDVTLVYDENNKQLMALGNGYIPPVPAYATYSSGSWMTAADIPLGDSLGPYYDIYSACLNGTTISAWDDAVSAFPYYALYNGATGMWTTAQPIPLGSSGTSVLEDVTLTTNVTNNQVFAFWADNNTSAVYYSIYQDSEWSLPATIPLGGSSGAKSNVYGAYDSGNNLIYAAWSDTTSNGGYVSSYDGMSWTTTAIPMGGTQAIDVTLAYYPGHTPAEMVAVWSNINGSNTHIYYSVLSGGTWSSAAAIMLGTSTGSSYPVFMTYDPYLGRLFAAWRDAGSAKAYFSYYSTYGMTSSWITAESLDFPSAVPAGPISLIYNNSTQQVMATWSNGTVPYAPASAIYNGSGWDMVQDIPLGLIIGANANVISSYDSTNDLVLSAWGNTAEPYSYSPPVYVPFSCLFNGTTWEPPVYIPTGDSVGGFYISAVYDSGLKKVFATWTDMTLNIPYYSIYDESGWTTGQPINESTMTHVQTNIALAYDSQAGQVIAAWGDSNNSRAPTYSVFSDADPMAGWSTISTIPQGASSGVNQNVYLTYNSASHQVFASWTDASTYGGFYNTYNGTTWSTAGSIPLTPSPSIGFDVTVGYNPNAQQVFAAWSAQGTNQPYVNSYNGSAWSSMATAIPLGVSDSTGAYNNVYLSYDPYSKEMFAIWADSTSRLPYSSTYSITGSVGSWDANATAIPPGSTTGVYTASNALSIAYNASSQQMFAIWLDNSNPYQIYYSYSPIVAPPPPAPIHPREFGRPENRR